jgi:hypothetical protein
MKHQKFFVALAMFCLIFGLNVPVACADEPTTEPTEAIAEVVDEPNTVTSKEDSKEGVSYYPNHETWWYDCVPNDASLTITMSAPSVSMMAEDGIDDYIPVTLWLRNADELADYPVSTDHMARALTWNPFVEFSPEEVQYGNSGDNLGSRDCWEGHTFFLRDGESVTITNLHRYLEYEVVAGVPDFCDSNITESRVRIDDATVSDSKDFKSEVSCKGTIMNDNITIDYRLYIGQT